MHITWKWKDAGCQDGLKYGVQVNKLWLLPGFSYTAEYLLLITPLLSMLINITSSFSKAFFSLSSPSISASWKPYDDAPASKYLKEGLMRKTLHNSQINNESHSPFSKGFGPAIRANSSWKFQTRCNFMSSSFEFLWMMINLDVD